ncbi:hypothetical protein LOTGIDRAFT_235926 [Lottia gigantea]|uniref:Tetraspanin n=1 Tax=Lottia gigantea TaxID=225164 RepID=V3ZL93_LOTGI|nr:hypothetical protein LOTGIDRAFT_235926 [Lottia gigantea]ESO85057.1 hypothetical protein LOTGIDRAFT_235926 [Lottia gigantea]
MAPRERSEVNICFKYFLFFANCIFLLIGLAETGVGSYVLYFKEKTIRTAIDFLFDPSVMLVFIGSIVIFVSFFGCVGSLRETLCCLKFYYIILTLLLLLEIIAIVFVFLFYGVPEVRTQLKLYPEDTLRDAVIQYREDEDMQNFIDEMQMQLKCCGLSNDEMGYRDWNVNQYFNCSDSNPSSERCGVPWSCCIIQPGKAINYQCGGNTYNEPTGIYTNGCLKGLEIWLNDNAIIIGGVAIGILIPQALFIYMGKTMTWQIQAQMDKWR